MATPEISWGYTDSVTTKKNLSVPDLSYATDYAVKESTPNKVVLVNRTTPFNQPEYIRYGYQSINDIYSGTGIEPTAMATSKRGVSVVGQLDSTLSVTCATESGCPKQILLPISAHWVLKTPISQYITGDILLAELLRSYSTAFGTGSTSSTMLEAIVRGALLPTGM